MITIFARSMLDGNRIHDTLKKKGMLKNINLTVPEALTYADKMAYGLIEWVKMIINQLSILFHSIHSNYPSKEISSTTRSNLSIFFLENVLNDHTSDKSVMKICPWNTSMDLICTSCVHKRLANEINRTCNWGEATKQFFVYLDFTHKAQPTVQLNPLTPYSLIPGWRKENKQNENRRMETSNQFWILEHYFMHSGHLIEFLTMVVCKNKVTLICMCQNSSLCWMNSW